MSKKRFVEFYLTAMLKAATGGRVRAYYIYYDMTHQEIMKLEHEHDHGGGLVEVPITGLGLVQIAAVATEKVREVFHET